MTRIQSYGSHSIHPQTLFLLDNFKGFIAQSEPLKDMVLSQDKNGCIINSRGVKNCVFSPNHVGGINKTDDPETGEHKSKKPGQVTRAQLLQAGQEAQAFCEEIVLPDRGFLNWVNLNFMGIYKVLNRIKKSNLNIKEQSIHWTPAQLASEWNILNESVGDCEWGGVDIKKLPINVDAGSGEPGA